MFGRAYYQNFTVLLKNHLWTAKYMYMLEKKKPRMWNIISCEFDSVDVILFFIQFLANKK